jgi:predicted O-methyltransferase YrrM
MFVINKQAIKLYYKIRHRRGHGIHSPFVYSLIVNVIENKHPYYAYRDIEKHIENIRGKKYKTKKINKLIFQLINYLKPKKILLAGSGKGINTLYATAYSSNIDSLIVEQKEANRKTTSTLLQQWQRSASISSTVPSLKEIYDCILLDFKFYINEDENFIDFIFSRINENSVVILDNIRTNAHVYSLVEQTRKDPRVRISLDLYQVAIFFFDKKYYKRNYLLSF